MKTMTYKARRTTTISWVLVSQFSFQDDAGESRPMSEQDAHALLISTRAQAEDMGFEIVRLEVETREAVKIEPMDWDRYEDLLDQAASEDICLVPEIVRTHRVERV